MKLIKQHKLLFITTLLLFIAAIYVTIQRPTFAVGGEMFLPLFPALIKGIATTNKGFKEVF